MLYKFIYIIGVVLACLMVNLSFANKSDSILHGTLQNRAEKLCQHAHKQHSKFISSFDKRIRAFNKVVDKVQSKLVYINPDAAQSLKVEIGNISEKLNEAIQSVKSADTELSNTRQMLIGYRSKADSFKTAFKFLASQLPETNKGTQTQLKRVGEYYAADDLLQLSEQLKEGYQLLYSYLVKFGLTIGNQYFSKEFSKISQLRAEIESLTSDPDKAMKRLLQLAYQQPTFAKFFEKNSQIASMFGINGTNTNAASNGSIPITGLQGRTQISQTLAQYGLSTPTIPQNGVMPDLSSPFEALKQKILQVGISGSQDLFTTTDKASHPRKAFFRHFELGINFQTNRSRNGFPARADMGISIGYKLNQQTVIGIGGAYKLGIGESIQKINLSNEGIELRSFADVKVKKSFWATAGYELHHYKAFRSIADISKYNLWQRSVLIGISKKIQLGSKKSAKMQILWEPLSFPANTISSPIKFRIGYQL